MPASPRRRLAAVLFAVALTVGCSSTVAGSAVTGSPAASSPAASSTGSAQPSNPPPGITVPSTRPPSAAAGTSAAGTSSAGAAAPAGSVGDPGIGDPYYPLQGNGGYQVDSYDLVISYDPPSNQLQSTATIKGSVTDPDGLSRFDLDLQPTMKVSGVTVNGTAATYQQNKAELVITPATLLKPKAQLQVVVTYGGQPGLIKGGTADLGDGGWYRTQSGGATAIGEPSSASAWYPVNEHPADPATFAVTAIVPKKWQVISNGIQQTAGLPDPGAGKAVFRWALSDPVASYLTTIYIDDFSTIKGSLPDGKPIVSAIGPGAGADAPDLARSTGPIITELEKYFGPYPLEAAGGIFTSLNTGFALETATRPTYGGGEIASFDTVVHELAHQWYGDDVAVQRWSDICLNECFASYAPWLYGADVNGSDLDATWKQQMRSVVDRPEFWSSPLVDMGAGNEFTRVYDRGPLALHALRNEIGDDAFFALLKQWPQTYGGKNVTFEDLEVAVTKLAGRNMKPFMDAWFRGTTVPAEKYRYPGDLGN